MPLTMTRAEYEQRYGVAPILGASESKIDTTPAPAAMTRAEYMVQYGYDPFTGRKLDNRGLFGKAEFGELFKKTYEPAVESVKGLGSFFGGGKESIGQDLITDISEGVKAFQEDKPVKGAFNAGFRFAGDFARAVYAPIGAALGALHVSKGIDTFAQWYVDTFADDLTNNPAFQKFALENPTIEKDIDRGLAIALSYFDAGLIEPKTFMPRTSAQLFKIRASVKLPETKIFQFKDNVTKTIDELGKVESNYVKLRKYNEYSSDVVASRERIARSGVLEGAIDVEGTIRTKQPGGAVEQYKKLTIGSGESIVRKGLEQEGKTINLAEVSDILTDRILSSSLEGADLKAALTGLTREIRGLVPRADEFGNIPLFKIQDAKINTTKNINYQTPPETATYRKTVARAYKEMIEAKSELPIKEVNMELGKYLRDIKRLENLEGRKVRGGKLGRYVAQIGGNITGGAVGGLLGGYGGVALGTIVGGEVAAILKGRSMSRLFGKVETPEIPKSAILEKAKAEFPLAKERNVKKTDPVLGAPKGIPRTKEVMKLERDIKENVKQQKAAIAQNDFVLVRKLKKLYDVLVAKLKEVVKRIKETPNKEGGFIRIPRRGETGSKGRKPQEQLTQESPLPNTTTGGDKLQVYKGEKDLTTKFLEYSKGKQTLSRQEIMDFARRPELKKGEADLLNRLGQGVEGKVSAQEFADSIRRDLLELKPVKVKEPQYRHTTIPESANRRVEMQREIENLKRQGLFDEAENLQLKLDELGISKDSKNYEEVVFESPIVTNGSSHYPNSKNYFAHARGDAVIEKGKKIWREQEIQSDLLQKEGMERLRPRNESYHSWNVVTANKTGNFNDAYAASRLGISEQKYAELSKKYGEDWNGLANEIDLLRNPELQKRMTGYNQLSPFTNDRFGERIMRERIREKAQKGYSKYRLPTGETIGKIEGFTPDAWYAVIDRPNFRADGSIQGNIEPLIEKYLKTGQEIARNRNAQGESWIITDILGDGRFKAVQKNVYEKYGNPANLKTAHQKAQAVSSMNSMAETFDLTGKSNPQFRRYSDWGKFLKNKYGGKEVTDPQGNTWVEIDLKPEYAKLPIEAFAVTPLLLGDNQ